MKTSEFDFSLPSDLIALEPAEPRDTARLLHIRQNGFDDRAIADLPNLLRPGDVLVLNNTRVIPARLKGTRPPRQPNGQGATIEVTLHKSEAPLHWQAFVKPAKRLEQGDEIIFSDCLRARVTGKGEGGECTLRFDGPPEDFMSRLHEVGTMPLPPYIASKRAPSDKDLHDYQTAYAKVDGAVAAPTAGLHLSDALMDRLRARGVEFAFLTLHVGAGTFLPVKVENVEDHQMHAEWGEIMSATADQLNQAKTEERRVVAVGTTSLRLLETAAGQDGTYTSFQGETDIFITPGHTFRSADVLLTNFHLPQSTLLMLIYAFGGTDLMRRAYEHAINERYRFYSYGDACLIERATS